MFHFSDLYYVELYYVELYYVGYTSILDNYKYRRRKCISR